MLRTNWSEVTQSGQTEKAREDERDGWRCVRGFVTARISRAVDYCNHASGASHVASAVSRPDRHSGTSPRASRCSGATLRGKKVQVRRDKA